MSQFDSSRMWDWILSYKFCLSQFSVNAQSKRPDTYNVSLSYLAGWPIKALEVTTYVLIMYLRLSLKYNFRLDTFLGVS
jgi:hypothetical protein